MPDIMDMRNVWPATAAANSGADELSVSKTDWACFAISRASDSLMLEDVAYQKILPAEKNVANQMRRPRRDQPSDVTEAIHDANREIHQRRSHGLAEKPCGATVKPRCIRRSMRARVLQAHLHACHQDAYGSRLAFDLRLRTVKYLLQRIQAGRARTQTGCWPFSR